MVFKVKETWNCHKTTIGNYESLLTLSITTGWLIITSYGSILLLQHHTHLINLITTIPTTPTPDVFPPIESCSLFANLCCINYRLDNMFRTLKVKHISFFKYVMLYCTKLTFYWMIWTIGFQNHFWCKQYIFVFIMLVFTTVLYCRSG